MHQKFENPSKPVLRSDTEFDAGVDVLFTGDDDIERASRSLKAMSHPLRLKILCTLGEKEVSVQDIVEQVGTSQSNISQHLAILREQGLVKTRRESQTIYYSLAKSDALSVIEKLHDIYCAA